MIQYAPHAFTQLERVLDFGATKHADTDAAPLLRDETEYLAAIERHLMRVGQDRSQLDEDTHCNALAHVAARALTLLERQILADTVLYPDIPFRNVEPPGDTWRAAGRGGLFVPPYLRGCGYGWGRVELTAVQRVTNGAAWSVGRTGGEWLARMTWSALGPAVRGWAQSDERLFRAYPVSP